MSARRKPKVLEFFAGGGLARIGLSEHFDTIWSNDIDPQKASAWIANFGPAGFVLGDVHQLDPATLPHGDLAWASFPCQDLSLAGARAGLEAHRSSSFYGFSDVIKGLKSLGRAPKILVIENVSGLLTSHKGRDFETLLRALNDLGYQAGALEIDARHFVSQSRPRVFIIACAQNFTIPASLHMRVPAASPFLSPTLLKAIETLPSDLRANYIWWYLPPPPKTPLTLIDLIDTTDKNWWPQGKTDALISSLNSRHHAKLVAIQATNTPHVGAIYRRTRTVNGQRRVYAEIRFDGLAGCLRTPSGGSSRQFLLFVQGNQILARALNAREAMRLMGVPDTYVLPKSPSSGLKIAGDGVVVPVVAWLSQHLLSKLV